jgi:hypothetical protein
MPTFDITDPVVADLGVPSASSATYTVSGVGYDHAIAGLPFLAASSDRYPYQRGLVDQRRQQVDTSDEPGEQSLEGWWLRSQSDFTGGAGTRFLEPVSDEFVARSFHTSVGVDVWTAGELSLLNDVESLKTLGSGATGCAVVASGGTEYLFSLDGSGVYRDGTAVTGWTSAPTSIVSAGSRLLACHASGIDVLASPFTTPTSLVTGAGSAPSAWWVKQRIMAAIGASLYEIPLSGGALPAALYTHPNSDWRWTAVVETPSAILAAGYAGSLSAIYRFTLDADGDLPVLSKAVTAAELPAGETIHGLFYYLGLLCIGTSRGVRVGQVDGQGGLVFGPLSYGSSAAVSAFAGRDRFVWFGVGDSPGLFDSGVSGAGLVRLDLSSTDGAGRYAWANDLRTALSGSVSAVQVLGNGRVAFTASDGSTGRLWRETATPVAAGGELTTGLVRFNTLEPKVFRNVRIRGDVDGGTVTVYQWDGTTRVSLATLDGATNLANLLETDPEPTGQLGLTLRLTPDGSDAPTLTGWQLRALPAVERSQLIVVPLMCFDRETDQFGNLTGTEGSALARYRALVDAVGGGQIVTYQDLNTGERHAVQVEDIQFTQTASAKNTESGFGGFIQVRMRTV